MQFNREFLCSFANIVDNEVVDLVVYDSGAWSYISNLECLSDDELVNNNLYKIKYNNVEYDKDNYLSSPDATWEISGAECIVTFPLTAIADDVKLTNAKNKKIEMIKGNFIGAPYNGYFCSSVGFKMDCKRDDINNMTNLITYIDGQQEMINMLPDGETKNVAQAQLDVYKNNMTIMDYDNNPHTGLTYIQVKNIINDLIGYGLWLYQHKWELNMQVEQATTIEQVNAIVWG